MSMSNATESDALDWALKGIDPAWRAGAITQNVSEAGDTVTVERA